MKRKLKGLDKYWSDIKDKLTLGLELRRSFESQWVMNLAFLTGNQYTAFNTAAHLLHRIASVPGKVRSVDNIILPKWQRQVSNLIKSRPQISVVPNSNQEEDIAAAKTSQKAAEWYFTNVLMKHKTRALASWIYSTGNAFLDDIWNRKKGPMGVDKKTGDVVYAGDVDCSVWSPFEIVAPVDFGTTEINDLPWIAKHKRYSLSWIEENLPRGGEVVEEKFTSGMITLETLIGGRSGIPKLGDVKSAYVCNMYIKPCNTYPKGAYFLAANGVVMDKQDYPYNEYPIEHFKDIQYPGVFWGEATMAHALGLQRSWNNDTSSIEEFNRNVAKIKIRTPMNSNLQIVPDNQHREIVQYKPVLGHKPEYMTPSGLSPTLDRNLERIMLSMENLFSQHEVSRGTNRSDIRSGDMVELLLEQDAHGTVPSHAIFEEGLENHLRRILQRMQAGYTTERVLKIGNTQDDFESVAFKGADLRSNNDVKIAKASSIPDSRAARTMRVERRYQQGLYGDPNNPKTKRKVLRMIDDAIVDDIYSGDKQDESLAAWENKKMLQGMQIPVNSYDNHQIHLEEIDRVRKSVRYHKLKEQDPNAFVKVDIIFTLHRQGHVKFLNAELKKQMQLMAVQQGGGRG